MSLIRLLLYGHFFLNVQLPQYMRYRVENLVMKIKDTKVPFYGTNFFKFKKEKISKKYWLGISMS